MKQGFDYIGVTVVFYCHDGKGNLLLHKRTQECRDEKGRWDCGGGALKFGESFEEGVKRELREEYCTSPVKLDFVGVNNVLRNHEGQKTHWIAVVFAVQIDPGKIKIGVPTKMEKLGWFKPEKLPTPLHSMYLTHLEFVRKAGIM